MGSIRRHSIQVTAKNSTIIKLFCLGTSLGAAVGIGGAIVAIAVGGNGVEGTTFTFSSVALGEGAHADTIISKRDTKTKDFLGIFYDN